MELANGPNALALDRSDLLRPTDALCSAANASADAHDWQPLIQRWRRPCF